jgi:hypothetical protein
MEKLRMAGCCLVCGQKGHMVKDCKDKVKLFDQEKFCFRPDIYDFATVTVGSLSCEVLSANSFSVLESLNGQDFPIEGCKDIISTAITEIDMQKSQSPCFVPRGTHVT